MAVTAEPDKHVHDTAGHGHGRAVVSNLIVDGMTCNNCARHVTEALQAVPGVNNVNVSLESQQAAVRWSAGASANIPALLKALEGAGYEGKPVEVCASCHEHEHDGASEGGWRANLWVGVVGTAFLMLGEWVFNLSNATWFVWVSFVVASAVQALAGGPFYRGAWKQAKVGRSNMDTLVALGSTTAFVYSTWALLTHAPGHLYFMEAASIITLISVGHWVEARVSTRASGALRQLMNLAPERARRVSAGNQIIEVSVGDLHKDDVVELRAGDRVPTDGAITDGNSTIDESMLTGESAPVEKTNGSPVFGGTINLTGRALMRVTAIGEETALAHIIAAVQRAQNSRADIQRIGDRVSSVFVPIVVGIALLAGCWWGFAPESAHHVHAWLTEHLWHTHPPVGAIASGFIIAAAVLIVACPCAMGLATPAAIMAASNAAARRGILIRDGVALEKAGTITAVVFDKTGTLTMGKPSVSQVWLKENGTVEPGPLSSVSADAKSQLVSAVALARNSSHPLSHAIAEALTSSESSALTSTEVRGSGVEAQSVNGLLRLGSLKWLKDTNVDTSPAEDFVKSATGSGATVVGFANNQILEAIFAIRDELKSGAADVIRNLQGEGLKVYLITGDNQATASSIARQAGVEAENVFAEIRPEHKADLVKKLQAEGQRIAFVGDGINDGPALEQADLGIAVSRASDVAREAADIVLLKSEIEAVPESLRLARATLRVIKQNLFWAFFYNCLGIPLAALGLMSPIICAAAMGFSDVIVIGNALRLLRRSR